MDVYSGVRWSAASKYGAQGMQFVVSIVLARLLAPEYFGLLGMATVVTAFVKTFRNLGFASAIVQRKRVGEELLSTLFWVNLAVCALVAGLVVAISPFVGALYGDPRVGPIVAALAVNFVLAGFTMVPSAVLQRRMAFKKLAVREIGAILFNGTTSITLAVLGFGVWALVAGTLAGGLGRMLLINLVCPFRPRLVWDGPGLRECLGFGLNLTGFSIVNYFARNADNLIIGAFLGATPLGYYALAYKLMLLPRNAVSQVVTRVLFPKLSRLQDDDEKLADVYLRACGAIAFVTFPLMAGLAVLAEPFVQVVLGAKWSPAVPLICLLAPVGALQSLWMMTGQVLLAKGRADWYFCQGFVRAALCIAAFLVGVFWGVIGVAAAYAIICVVWSFVAFWLASHHISSLTLSAALSAILPTAASAATVAAVGFAIDAILTTASAPKVLALPVSALAASAAYLAATSRYQPDVLSDMQMFFPIRPALGAGPKRT